MSADFQLWADSVKQLHRRLAELEPVAARVAVPPPKDADWFELLEHKLLPQLARPALLIVAVVGGTNIGKSVLFNHLTGEDASGVSPLAAGTKHPVCLVPKDLADSSCDNSNSDSSVLMESLFEGFQLKPWQSPQDPLEENESNRMFWRVGKNVPSRLLLLDTPDVDSDVSVNWARARAIRQVSDVLIAVLTQQKYNDAAVKQFFREAAAADKPILIVFNQCDLLEDADYWPQWLDTFITQTDADPQRVYVVPMDREAAGKQELPFYEVGTDGRRPIDRPADLREDLASLHFDAIKIRTFRGALARLVDPKNGVEAYLASIRSACDDFSTAAKALSAGEMARVAWPALPATILVDEVRAWWDSDRAQWSRRVHGFYRKLGRGVTWPLRAAYQALGPGRTDPLESLRRQERRAIVAAVENLLGELQRLAEVGNDTLRPRLSKLLGGDARQKLLDAVRAAHEELPAVDSDYRAFLRQELDTWQRANPRVVKFLRSLDQVAAVARPALTVSLAVSGWVVAGDLVGQAAMQAVGQTAGGLATEAAIAGGITGGGEALVSTTTEGIRQAAVKLLGRLQARYAQQRAQWLAQWLEKSLLGELLEELRQGAEAENCEAFRGAEAALHKIRGMCS